MLGRLVVGLGLDASEYTRGLSKAEYEAQRMSQRVQASLGAVVAGWGAVVAASTGAALALQGVVKGVANYQDIADKIGTTADEVTRLQLAADLSGTSMESITAASVKLSAALSSQDEESKGAAAGLRALGLDFEKFVALNPVDRLQELADAMAGFKDGTGKTAVAVAILGKSGAEAIPFLKDLNEEGRQQVRLSPEQIQALDNVDKAYARLSSTVSGFAQALTSSAVLAVDQLIGRFKDGQREGEGFLKTLLRQTEIARLLGVNRAPSAYTDAREDVAKYSGILATGSLRGNPLAQMQARLAEAQARQAAFLSSAGRGDPRAFDPDGRLTVRPTLDGFRNEAPKERKLQEDKRAEQYIEQLRKQLLGAQELTVAERVLQDIRSGSLGKVTAAQEASLLVTAREIDAVKSATAVAQDRAKQREAEAKGIAEYESQLLQAELQRQQRLRDLTGVSAARQQANDLGALDEAFFSGSISANEFEAGLRKVYSGLEETAGKAAKLDDISKSLGMTFTSAFEDAILKGEQLSDVLKALVQDVARLFLRKALIEPAAGYLSSLFGGFFADGGTLAPGKWGIVGERGPEVIQGGSSGVSVAPIKLGSSTSGGVNITLHAGAGVNRSEVMAAMQMAADAAVARIDQRRMRGAPGYR